MPLEEPSWWYARHPTMAAKALAPLGRLYGLAARRRFFRTTPYRSPLPVICIGNFTAGGTGKTPAAIHIVQHLAARGERPACLTRGYGGSIKGPHWVDADADSAAMTGDEALLLARHCPTLIAKDRREGARAIEAAAFRPSVIIMDDGLQNPSLAKDLTLAIVDAARGLGNGAVIPAGPLRAPIDFQLALADAVIINQPALAGRGAQEPRSADHQPGGNNVASDWVGWLRQHFAGPVINAQTQPKGDTAWLRGTKTIAFAGIGAPSRFFALLENLGAIVVARRSYRDHHVFGEHDAAALIAEADGSGAQLVTTQKDLVRLHGNGTALDELKVRARALPIELVFPASDMVCLAALLDKALNKNRSRG